MEARLKDQLHLHFVVLLFGFTGILGKLITVGALELVFYRMLIAALAIGLIASWRKIKLTIPVKDVAKIMSVGVIVALHWLTFFGAIKLSNVSVTLGCMATASLFTSFLEPLILKRKLAWLEVLMGLIVIAGLYIIFRFAFEFYLGIIAAVSSAFLAALFGVLNKGLVDKHPPELVSFYEMLSGFLVFGLVLLFSTAANVSTLVISASDMIYIAILGILCTAYAFVATVELLRRLSAFFVSLAINLEPIYAIILARLIFGESEKMQPGFYLGAILIIGSVLAYPALKKRLL